MEIIAWSDHKKEKTDISGMVAFKHVMLLTPCESYRTTRPYLCDFVLLCFIKFLIFRVLKEKKLWRRLEFLSNGLSGFVFFLENVVLIKI